MIQHRWKSPLFSLTSKRILLTKKFNVQKLSPVSSRGQGMLTYFMYLPWPLLEAVLPISTFHLFHLLALELDI